VSDLAAAECEGESGGEQSVRRAGHGRGGAAGLAEGRHSGGARSQP